MKSIWTKYADKFLSGFGGAVAVFCVFWMTQQFEQSVHLHLPLVASFGATAVLLFASPRMAYSQPWNVIGGHVISAFVGVAVYKVLPQPIMGASISVGLAITLMYFLKCIHPPGGATSIIPFLSADAIVEYGFWFVLMPIGLGAVVIVLIAIAFNYPFKYRRYPGALGKQELQKTIENQTYTDISHADFVTVLSEVETYADISEEDLLELYKIGTRGNARSR